jgi:hypothetical protein
MLAEFLPRTAVQWAPAPLWVSSRSRPVQALERKSDKGARPTVSDTSSAWDDVSSVAESPAFFSRRFREAVIRSCTATAITRPFGPTRRASSSVKKPIPGPGSSTMAPSFTYGARILPGSWLKRRTGLAGRYPSHHGQTRFPIVRRKVVTKNRLRKLSVCHGELPRSQAPDHVRTCRGESS